MLRKSNNSLKKLKIELIKRDITMTELAFRLGVTRRAIYKALNGNMERSKIIAQIEEMFSIKLGAA